MRKHFLLGLIFSLSSVVVEAAPINNAVPPCDNSGTSGKPPCSIDSDAVIPAPKTPDATDGAIIFPEKPTKGLPNRTQKPGSKTVPDVKPPIKKQEQN